MKPAKSIISDEQMKLPNIAMADAFFAIFGMKRVDEKTPYWTLDIPGLVTKSEANQREHWAIKSKRAKRQKSIVGLYLQAAKKKPNGAPPVVRMVRIGKRDLDSDNLAGAFKGCRDSLATWLGINDGNPCTSWTYAQERGPVGIRIEFWR